MATFSSALGKAEQAVARIDLTSPSSSGRAPVTLFGVEHTLGQHWISRFILEHLPSEVIVETAISLEHGSQTGNVVTFCDGLRSNALGDSATLGNCCRLAAQLQQIESTAIAPVLQRLGETLFAEQLVYAAAFAVGAKVIFGDRPKKETWKRLDTLANAIDLDTYYGEMVDRNYRLLLDPTKGCARNLDPRKVGIVERILLLERHALLCRSLIEASARVGTIGGKYVCGVVGIDHLEAVAGFWDSGISEELLNEGTGGAGTPVGGSWCNGVKRGIMENAVALGAREEIVEDLQSTLGGIETEHLYAYNLTNELFASQRMQLASLSRDTLSSVCEGWNCSMWTILEPVRRLRPINGGTGFDTTIVNDLRLLNFQVG